MMNRDEVNIKVNELVGDTKSNIKKRSPNKNCKLCWGTGRLKVKEVKQGGGFKDMEEVDCRCTNEKGK